MKREEAVALIHEHLDSLKKFEPRSTVYTGPEGSIDAVVYNLTGMDPRVEFEVRRGGELPQSFSNMTIAMVYLFRQTPHIQREEKKRHG